MAEPEYILPSFRWLLFVGGGCSTLALIGSAMYFQWKLRESAETVAEAAMPQPLAEPVLESGNPYQAAANIRNSSNGVNT